jgi:hypothetical protein
MISHAGTNGLASASALLRPNHHPMLAVLSRQALTAICTSASMPAQAVASASENDHCNLNQLLKRSATAI